MIRIFKIAYLVPALCFVLSACTVINEPAEVLSQAVEAPITPRFVTAAPTAVPEVTEAASLPLKATAWPSPRPSMTPSPAPSSTPLPVIAVSVPGAWAARAAAAIERLNDSPAGYEWRLANPGEGDVHLVNDSAGAVVQESSIVLAVPFTMEWDEITREQADKILSDGHESVSIMPWSELPTGQKALRIDRIGPADAHYPFKETWSLVSDPELNGVVAELLPLLREDEKSSLIHLAAVGDIMLDRALGAQLSQGDLYYPFLYVADRLRTADITVGNMESALGNLGEPEQKRYPFRAPPEAAAALSLAGFDVVSLANNHGMDFGQEALLQAVALLGEQGIVPVGAGATSTEAHTPGIVEVNGLRVAFLGYVDVPPEASTGFDTASWTATAEKAGTAWADPEEIAFDIAAAGEQSDLVVVLLHSGVEYQAAPSEPQRTAARAAVDAGADLVIGHHAHVLQGIEYYGDGVIIYGTGNFAFEIDGAPETAIFHVWLDNNGVHEIAIEPAFVQFGGQPRLAEHWEAPAVRNRIYYLSNLLAAE